MKKLFLCILVLCHAVLLYGQKNMLSSGDWFKFGFAQKGVYKITGQQLQNIGVELSNIDPAKLKVYGNGAGGMLPQAIDQSRRGSLQEMPIYVAGGNDGSFSAQDFILFYGNSPHNVFYDTTKQIFDLEQNVYSDSSFVFVTINGVGEGKRLTEKDAVPVSNNTVKVGQHFEIIAEDKINLLSQGRSWYGDEFSNLRERDYTYSFPVSGFSGNMKLNAAMMAGSIDSSYFEFKVNNTIIGKFDMRPILDRTYVNKGFESKTVFDIPANITIGNRADINIRYSYTDSDSRGFTDYLMMQYDRRLAYTGEQFFFRNVNSRNFPAVSYELSNSGNANQVWDVTDPVAPKLMSFSNNSNLLVFSDSTKDMVREYVALNLSSNLPSAKFVERVQNQDLYALTNVDALIVTHPLFLSAAQRLANYHLAEDGLQTAVVTVGQIYNEFSGGAQDITAIRDFTKYLYDGSNTLKYLLLFGDCSYDYKNRIGRRTNFVPTYEARHSLHPIYSYSSEDYYGFLEDDEGEWSEGTIENGRFAVDHTLDIGVGRLPVNNVQQAEDAVDKIIFYKSIRQTSGDWRNTMYFVADDGDGNRHQSDAERLSILVDSTYDRVLVDKLYLDAFNQEPSPNGEKSPEASQALNEAFDKGGLILNYSGHGNENRLADEDIFLSVDGESLTNRKRMPLIVTATCQFGRYDNPFLVSGAEKLMNNPAGGAIAMLTTTRPVFANSNFVINSAFYKQVFSQKDGEFNRLGDVLRDTKNESLAGVNNRNFTLLGDPMMRLNYPKQDLSIEISEALDTIRALETVTLSGNVLNLESEKDSLFNGLLNVTVFDKENISTTLGTESSPRFNFRERNSVLFRGQVSVKSGSFTIRFVVPKNIRYEFGQGKVIMYALDSARAVDASGGVNELIVGGSSSFDPDNTGPEIKAFLNEDADDYSREVGANPLLIVRLKDENGINLTDNGLSQFISATLDNEVTFKLNDFYTALKDSYQEGVVFYPLNDLEPGDHVLKIKAWDTYNNSSTTEVIFSVSGEGRLFLTDIKNYPNPFMNKTTFSFIHDRLEEDLIVSLFVTDLYGGEVFRKSITVEAANRIVTDLTWDINADLGGKVMPGIYMYRLAVFSKKDGTSGDYYSRLIVGN